MTDARGRRARWTAALVVAPSAAAIFGASVTWASHTTPATLTNNAPTTAAKSAVGSGAASGARPRYSTVTETVALRHALAEDARRAKVLGRHLAAAHRQLAQLKKLAQIQARTPAGSGGGPVAGYQPGAGVGPAPAPIAVPLPIAVPAPIAAAPVPVVVQAPPPPVQVVTGASGAVR